MLNLYNDVCTLYHKNGAGYIRTVIPNVSFQSKTAVKTEGHGIVSADYAAVFIPDEYAGIPISTGDLIVFGECGYTLPPKTAKELLNDFDGVITVKSIARQRLHGISHREVIGE